MEKNNHIEFSKELRAEKTPIEGLVVYDLTVHGDNRGWFKENWQREKMTSLGLPDFGPVQNNVSFNAEKGVTRGLHAEPWDKYVSIGAGRVYGAWCDLREGSSTYGQSYAVELDPSKAIYVPRGVANGFQALDDGTVYMYLVNDHWSPNGEYSFVNLADSSLRIDWPIALNEAELSEKDRHHPLLTDATPIKPKKVLITGADGQLGRALQVAYPQAECVSRQELDITDMTALEARHWKDYRLILNAAAFTAVDQAETSEGRESAWKVNATAVANLAKIATKNNITLVHISSDYVFDGTKEIHSEDESFSPLSVYGQTKAAGDLIVSNTPKHYIVRTSWVIGEGNNFVKIMRSLAEKGVKPNVVNDQIGRITFTDDIAKGIAHLVSSKAPYGTYNITSSGEPVSWAQIAKEVYVRSGKEEGDVTPVSTETYYQGKENIAPRPLQSTLNIDKIVNAGFVPREWRQSLGEYLDQNDDKKEVTS